jgi:aspartyl-tRNA synthetase
MQYDLALNGFELGGGAIRETNINLLQKVFEKLGNSKEHFENQFAHYIEAFSYGVPPHGGIALGFDRLIMILQNEPNIREVIAFPKTGDNRDLMMDSPSQASADQLKELNIKKIK